MKIPPKYIITPDIVDLLAKIESVRLYLLSLNITPNITKKIQRKSFLKSSLYSAKIEGNPLSLNNYQQSPDQTRKLEINNILKAINYITKLKNINIDSKLLKTLHQMILNNINYQAGQYRHQMSAIFNQSGVAIYVCPPPKQVSILLEELIEYINSNQEPYPLIKAIISHLLFEKIHPFLDGNGRVGRLLIHVICQKHKYYFNPSVSFEEYLSNHLDDYYYSLDIGLKDPNRYIFFMLNAVYQQITKLKNDIENEINQKTSIDLPPRQEEIFNILRDHQVVSFDFIKRRFLKVPDRTIRYDLKRLTDKQLIIKIGETRGSYYKINKLI